MARGYAEARKTEKTRLSHARAFCAAAITSYWSTLCRRHGSSMKIRPAAIALPALALDVQRTANAVGELIAEFPVEDAGYLIGSVYTVMLPTALRSEMGAYYTPPPLVTRMLDLAEQAGFDFTHGTVIDPACGGGAFLAPVALRMWQRDQGASPEWTFRRIAKRLRGIEIDPFAAWMTRVLLEAALMPLCIAAKRRLPDVVTVSDALRPTDIGTFDLVIGNPPYGRVTLDEAMRNHYARSLYGHANLYGLFTDLAMRLTKPNGVVAYLTPTSFLGGQYFKALRQILMQEMTPVAFDFVADREGVFDDVLQETLLAAYTRREHADPAAVSLVIPKGLNAAKVEPIGAVALTKTGDPWLLPRSAGDAAFLSAIDCMPTRLSDLGYAVSTGPLVWNRHKTQLRTESCTGALPLIWAESVVSQGFVFSAERRNHVPYILVQQDQAHLVVRKPCVLVQRTTSKEQNRRILAAVLPEDFLAKFGGAVVENHLNMVVAPSPNLAQVAPGTISALLNTEAVDRAFRCISGSVAVSAYELNALPLPTVKQVKSLEKSINEGASQKQIERIVAGFYGVS
ncbi:HsdM family class I SAM-dependent methyltransferase [Cupriavidus taiwanensis]|uniref:HsdM family class I SAM-dependent methyltransferase n=1 Tax=Cupriavidus taiwanensis TaxID=164546 RepID=UPI000E2F775C|nr:Eco57I restriction-modification methylase domain-containing protein [Cupriavidus taiwanensis]